MRRRYLTPLTLIGILCAQPFIPEAKATTTIDAGVLSQLAKKIAKLTEQLSKMTQITQAASGIVNTEQQLMNAIGGLGSELSSFRGMTLTGLLGTLEMGLQSGTQNGVMNLTSQITNNVTNGIMSSMSAIEQAAAIRQQSLIQSAERATTNSIINTLNKTLTGKYTASQTKDKLNASLYTPSGNPSSSQIQDIAEAREGLMKETIAETLTQSDALTQNTVEKDSKVPKTLDTDRNKTKSVRAYVQEGTAATLKTIDVERSGNIMLSLYLRLESSHSLMDQPTRPPNTAAGPENADQ